MASLTRRMNVTQKTVDNLNYSLDDLDIAGTERFSLEEIQG